MDFWSIKRVQTRGIVKYEGCKEYCANEGEAYASRNPGRCMSPDYVFERVDHECFRTEAEAIAHATVRIERAMKGLDRRRKKLAAILADLASGGNGAPKRKR